MGRPCGVCSSSAARAIDKALLQRQPLASIGRKYSQSTAALNRHAQNHLHNKPVAVKDIADDDGFETWLQRVRLETPDDILLFAKLQLYRLERLADKAEESGDLRTAMAGATAALKSVADLFAKTSGLLHDGATVDASTRVVAVLSGLSEADLRGLIAGATAKALPAS